MTILITGAAGFIGHGLAEREALREKLQQRRVHAVNLAADRFEIGVSVWRGAGVIHGAQPYKPFISQANAPRLVRVINS